MFDYEKLLSGLRLRHFKAHEIIRYANQVRSGVKNSLPPRELWANIIPTLWVLDHLRASLGARITLTSIYRDDAYNRAVGGAAGSQHKQNRAIDFQISGVSPTVAKNHLVALRKAGMFRGGIGIYPTFVHIDTRGTNVTW